MPRVVSVKQRRIWELRQAHPEWPMDQIAEKLGLARSAAIRRLEAAERKLGKLPDTSGDSPRPARARDLDDGAYGEWLTDLAEPRLKTIAKLAIEGGLAEDSAKSMVAKLQRDFVEVGKGIRTIKRDELLKLIDSSALKVFESIHAMTPAELALVPLRDRAVVAGILFDKGQLLRNLPTEIVRTQEEQTELTQVGKLLLKEVARRSRVHGEPTTTFDIDIETGQSRPMITHESGG